MNPKVGDIYVDDKGRSVRVVCVNKHGFNTLEKCVQLDWSTAQLFTNRADNRCSNCGGLRSDGDRCFYCGEAT